MGIFSRLSDIINSNISAILDKAEDPDKIIRMVIQEMEDTLVEVRSSAARTIADQKDIERRIKKLGQAQNDWEAKAELALSKGREDLAKGALIEKKKIGEMLAHLQSEQQQLTDALSRHEDDVVKLDAKLREARAKKAAIEARTKTAINAVKVKRNLYDNRIQDAFDRFDKVENRLDRIEAEADALDLGRDEANTLEAAFNDLESTEEIENELAKLKAKVSSPAKSATKTAKTAKAAK